MIKCNWFLAFVALGFCGCLGPAPKTASNWAIEFWRAGDAGGGETEAKADVVRVSQIGVRAPYDGTRLAVMRPDGSLAFDSYNAFAASPAQMLRGAVHDAVEASGVFSRVLATNSGGVCDLTLETTITRLALDCRKEGRRDATVELTFVLLNGREAVASAHAEGKAATSDGDYSAAFSRALAKAVRSAISEIYTEPANDN